MAPAKAAGGGAKGGGGRKAANGYKLPDPLPEGEIIKAPNIKKQWRLGKSIGVGGFGEIYLCSENVGSKVGDDAKLAMKIEPHENGPLFVEMNFYIRAAQPKDVEQFKKDRGLKSLGMPVLRGNGSHFHNGTRYRFLVMDRFGKDIQKIFHNGKTHKPFSTKAAYTLAIKIIDVLEYIHEQGYVHNDIKAQNLLLGHGRQAENDVYLVDFGLVSKYLRDGVHLEYKPDARKAHDGTIEYTSRDAHIGAHARRSDLEILGYNLVHWISGELPWMDILTNPKTVQARKNAAMNDIPGFMKSCFGKHEHPSELESFMEYVAELDFDTEPDYDQCREFFVAGLKKRKSPYDGRVDFAAAKSPPKKVGTSSTAAARARSRTPSASPKKRARTPAKKTQETPKAKLSTPKVARSSKKRQKDEDEVQDASKKKQKMTKDSASQTSPGFVEMAKKARAKQKAQAAAASKNAEMEEFVGKAKKAAKDANARNGAGSARKSPRAKKASSATSSNSSDAMSNPTPTMLAMMQKRAEKEAAASAKKRRK